MAIVLLDHAEPAHLWSDVVAVRPYHPWDGGHNPAFTRPADGLVLDLKFNLDVGVEAAIGQFSGALQLLATPEPVWLACVPGHDAKLTNTERALGRVIGALAATWPRRFHDGTDILIRHTDVEKKAQGGARDPSIEWRSIRVTRPMTHAVVIVLDDVTTSGSSLTSCRDILLGAKAAMVGALALGLTTR